MENNKLIKWSFWLSIVAIVASVTTILLWIVNACGVVVVTLDSFVGVIVTLLTVLVTIVLGWQIYNAVEIKDKMNSICSLEAKFKQQEHRTDQMFYNASHHLAYTEGRIAAKEQDFVSAYRFSLNALCNTLLLDTPINVEVILPDMLNYAKRIPNGSVLDREIMDELDSDHDDIIHSPIFSIIQLQYMETYNIFKSKVHSK